MWGGLDFLLQISYSVCLTESTQSYCNNKQGDICIVPPCSRAGVLNLEATAVHGVSIKRDHYVFTCNVAEL